MATSNRSPTPSPAFEGSRPSAESLGHRPLSHGRGGLRSLNSPAVGRTDPRLVSLDADAPNRVDTQVDVGYTAGAIELSQGGPSRLHKLEDHRAPCRKAVVRVTNARK